MRLGDSLACPTTISDKIYYNPPSLHVIRAHGLLTPGTYHAHHHRHLISFLHLNYIIRHLNYPLSKPESSLLILNNMSRRPNAAADRAAQNQQTLKSLVKLEGNKTCADCKRNKRRETSITTCDWVCPCTLVAETARKQTHGGPAGILEYSSAFGVSPR